MVVSEVFDKRSKSEKKSRERAEGGVNARK